MTVWVRAALFLIAWLPAWPLFRIGVSMLVAFTPREGSTDYRMAMLWPLSACLAWLSLSVMSAFWILDRRMSRPWAILWTRVGGIAALAALGPAVFIMEAVPFLFVTLQLLLAAWVAHFHLRQPPGG